MTIGRRHGRSPAEWITLAISVAVVGMLVAVALREESRVLESDGAYIEVTFDVGRVTTRNDVYFVPFMVVNTGSVAIESAEIWIEAYEGEELVDSAEVTVQFLPISGNQHGIYVTSVDPATHELRGRLESLLFP